jgi:hypothetical protein
MRRKLTLTDSRAAGGAHAHTVRWFSPSRRDRDTGTLHDIAQFYCTHRLS